MFNSSLLFAAFIALTIFGYLSLIRILFKNQFPNKLSKQTLNSHNVLSLIEKLGHSLIFSFIPAIGIALFWGWAPGLLWFFICHFLIINSYNLVSCSPPNLTSLLAGNTPLHSKLIRSLLYAYLIFSASFCIYFLAELINSNTGILFALAALLPAYSIFKSGKNILIKAPLALVVFIIGIIFSQKLGLLIYGGWTPFETLTPWLQINNTTLIGTLIVFSCFTLKNNSTFCTTMNTFSGALIALLLVALLITIGVFHSPIDAPLHDPITSSPSRPSFIFLCVLLFLSLGNIIINAISVKDNANPENTFAVQQASSLLHLIIIVAIFISLSTANGIGAWKTHYLDWPTSLNLLDQLTLIIKNITATLFSAQANDLKESLLLSAICIIGINTTLVILQRLSTTQQLTKTQPNKALSGFHSLPILLLSFYFVENNLSINVWLLFGLLNWLLFSWLFTQFNLLALKNKASIQNQVIAAINLSIIAIGFTQTFYISYQWWLDGHLLLILFSLCLSTLAITLLFSPCWKIIAYFKIKDEDSLFE